MIIKGRAVTSSIKETLENIKYGAKVATHLGLTRLEHDQIDWKAHARVVKHMNSSATTKLVWEMHPTRTRMKMTRQHPSANCPLCGEKDILDHFLGCTGINGVGPYLDIRNEMRHRANKIGTPDNAINLIAKIMEGEAVTDRFLKKNWANCIQGTRENRMENTLSEDG